jgi:hypothetical protein
MGDIRQWWSRRQHYHRHYRRRHCRSRSIVEKKGRCRRLIASHGKQKDKQAGKKKDSYHALRRSIECELLFTKRSSFYIVRVVVRCAVPIADGKKKRGKEAKKKQRIRLTEKDILCSLEVDDFGV